MRNQWDRARVVAALGLILGCTAAGSQHRALNGLEVLPDSIRWTANAATPPGAEVAVLVGQPRSPGLYAFRLRFPSDYKVMPHTHPEDRIYTVLAGTWYIGLGSVFDSTKVRGFGPGEMYRVPAGTAHFHWAKSGESIVQVNGVGPTATDYLIPADDPRRK